MISNTKRIEKNGFFSFETVIKSNITVAMQYNVLVYIRNVPLKAMKGGGGDSKKNTSCPHSILISRSASIEDGCTGKHNVFLTRERIEGIKGTSK